MVRKFVCSFVLIVAGQCWSPACHAQLVQVAPGYVKAPFVRVYSNPDGSSYVRAPFVRVYSPGYRRGYPVYSGPSIEELPNMDWRSLGQAVRAAATQLSADLDQIPSGATLRSRLKIAEITALVPADADFPPSDEVRQQLSEILQLQRALDSQDSRQVANLRSFQVLQAALAEYVTPPDQRLRQQVFFTANKLNRALGRFATGRGWQDYLMLSAGQALSEENAAAPGPSTPPNDFGEALTRFDAIRQNPDYGVISALPEFTAARQRLAEYLGQVETTPLQQPEELPMPDSNAVPQAAQP